MASSGHQLSLVLTLAISAERSGDISDSYGSNSAADYTGPSHSLSQPGYERPSSNANDGDNECTTLPEPAASDLVFDRRLLDLLAMSRLVLSELEDSLSCAWNDVVVPF